MSDRLRMTWRVWFIADPGFERDAYVSALRSSGLETEGVGSVEEADGRLAAGQSADLLILDLLPAPEKAWELLARLRSGRFPANMIFTTLVRPDRANRDRARELGCAAFVAKPCAPPHVANIARQLCQGARGLEVVAYH